MGALSDTGLVSTIVGEVIPILKQPQPFFPNWAKGNFIPTFYEVVFSELKTCVVGMAAEAVKILQTPLLAHLKALSSP